MCNVHYSAFAYVDANKQLWTVQHRYFDPPFPFSIIQLFIIKDFESSVTKLRQ